MNTLQLQVGTPAREASPREVALSYLGHYAHVALARMSEAFAEADLEGLLAQFSAAPATTYAGSESGEVATGADGLRLLLGSVLARPQRYSFSFHDLRTAPLVDGLWLLAEGVGQEHSPGGRVVEFPYRATGILVPERGEYRWSMFSGSEPSA